MHRFFSDCYETNGQIHWLTCSQILVSTICYLYIFFQMVKWFNGESMFWSTNGEMVRPWYGEMVIWYDGLNMSIWFGGSEFFPPGHFPGNISWDIFLVNFFDQDNYRGVVKHTVTYASFHVWTNQIYIIVCIEVSPYPRTYPRTISIRLSTSQDIVPACPGRDWFCAEPVTYCSRYLYCLKVFRLSSIEEKIWHNFS